MLYNTNNVTDCIKGLLNKKHISASKMLIDLDLGVNALYQFEKGRVMSSFNLARIADYLDCSVDYLLGREKNANQVIHDNHEIIGDTHASVTISNGAVDAQEKALLELFHKMDAMQRARLLIYADDLLK